MKKTKNSVTVVDPRSRIVEVRKVRAEDIAAHPGNWRDHPDAQAEAIAGVMREVGDVGVLLAWHSERNGGKLTLIDGHLRRGISPGHEYHVAITDLTDAEADYVLATHDPLAAMAKADAGALDALLSTVNSSETGVQKMLADLAKASGLDYAAQEADAEPQIDKAEELNKKWQVRTGDLWRIGEHRLLCGDSTKAEDVQHVMDGEKVTAVLTDPPYGQNQPGVPNDSPGRLQDIVVGALRNIPATDAVCIAFSSPRTFTTWLDSSRSAGHRFERMLWLYKAAQMAKPWRGWLLTSEAILVSSLGNAAWNEVKPYAHDCYYKSEVSNQLQEGTGWHGSVKPLDVVSDLLSRITVDGALVYDPFVGSGTTMVACENLGRKCRAIDISQAYCAVILERMATAFPALAIERMLS